MPAKRKAAKRKAPKRRAPRASKVEIIIKRK